MHLPAAPLTALPVPPLATASPTTTGLTTTTTAAAAGSSGSGGFDASDLGSWADWFLGTPMRLVLTALVGLVVLVVLRRMIRTVTEHLADVGTERV